MNVTSVSRMSMRIAIQRTSKWFQVIPNGLLALKKIPLPVNATVRYAVTDASSISKIGVKSLATPSNKITIKGIDQEDGFLRLSYNVGSPGKAPFLWLRDNCQCHSCFDPIALGRKSQLQDIDVNIKPNAVELQNNKLTIHWNDDHISTFSPEWLFKRSFTPASFESFRSEHKLEREPWGKGVTVDNFEYHKLRVCDEYLLRFLTTLERKGVGLVKNTPNDVEAASLLIDHIAFCKITHFGRRSPVRVRELPNNVAQSGAKLGLHNDLAQYDHQPGLIFLQMVKQHQGIGGDSVISDGLFCSEILRKRFPEEFKILSETPVFYWDKGFKGYELELDDFHKISKHCTISLDKEGNLNALRVNNQKRDSHMDLDPDMVIPFYKALKTFTDILYEHSYSCKLISGDILVLDNIRCLHGREAYESFSDRHLETSYLDWDEVRCKRRRLQDALKHIQK